MARTSAQHRRTYKCWQDMKARCYTPTCHNYPNYGGRGIRVCDRWIESFSNFVADMGLKPDGLTLDRIETNGHYEPGNCRWANRAEQRRNQRDCIYLTLDGITKTAEEWAHEVGLHPETIRRRKKKGLSDEEVLKTPSMERIPMRCWAARTGASS